MADDVLEQEQRDAARIPFPQQQQQHSCPHFVAKVHKQEPAQDQGPALPGAGLGAAES